MSKYYESGIYSGGIEIKTWNLKSVHQVFKYKEHITLSQLLNSFKDIVNNIRLSKEDIEIKI